MEPGGGVGAPFCLSHRGGWLYGAKIYGTKNLTADESWLAGGRPLQGWEIDGHTWPGTYEQYKSKMVERRKAKIE